MTFINQGFPRTVSPLVVDSHNADQSGSAPTAGVSGKVFAAAGGYVAGQGFRILRTASDAAFDRANEFVDSKIRGAGKGTSTRSGRGSKTSLRATARGNSDGGGNSGGGGNGSNSSGNPNNYLGPFPGTLETLNAPIEWSSGINSGVIVNPNQGYHNHWSPMFITCGSFFPDLELMPADLKDSFFTSILNADVFYDYLRAAENSINRELSSQFAKADFVNYILVTLRAIQIYYCIDSILAYSSDTSNYNPAMDALRNRITPVTISGHLRLKEKLERETMSGVAVNFIRFMYQNFALSEDKGAPIIRISFGELLADDLVNDYLANGSQHTAVIDLMNEAKYTKVSSYIRRSFPDWRIKLLPSTSEVIYSDQFINFWHNHLNTCKQLSTSVNNPGELLFNMTADAHSQEKYYGIEGQELDGMIYACTSIFDTSQTPDHSIHCGLWMPITTHTSKQEINNTSVKFYHSNTFKGLDHFKLPVAALLHSAFAYDSVEKSFEVRHYPLGNKRLAQVHTITNMKQAISESVRYLLKPSKLPEPGKPKA